MRLGGFQFVEPSFATIIEEEGSEVHGLLTKLSKQDAGHSKAMNHEP